MKQNQLAVSGGKDARLLGRIPFRFHISIEKILIAGIQGGVLLIFALPLLVIPEAAVFPVRIFNNFLFRVIIEIITLFYFILVLYNRAYLPRFSPLSLAVFLFIGTLGISTLLGLHPWRSFWGDILRAQGYVFFLHILLFYIVLTGTFRNRERWAPLIRFMLLVSSVLAIRAIVIHLTTADAQRIVPMPENPGFYGSYLVLIFFLNLFWILEEKQKALKILSVSALFLNLVALVLNETRGAWIAVFAGFLALLLFWLFFLSKNQLRKRIVVGASIICLLFSFFFILLVSRTYFPDNSSLGRYYSLWNEPFENIQERFLIWKTILPSLKEPPLFGYGLESFQYVYEKNYQHAFSQQYPTSPISFYHAHNQFIDTLIISGFLGLFSYLGMFGIAIFLLARRFHQTINPFSRICLIVILIAHTIESLFLFETLYALLLLYSVFAFISVVSSHSTQNLHAVPSWSPIKSILALSAVGGIAISLYIFHWQPIRAHFYLQQAGMYLERVQVEKGINALEHSIKIPSFMTFDVMQFGLYDLLSAQPKVQDTSLEKEFMQKLDLFAQLLQKKVDASPTYPSIHPKIYLAEAYMSLYRFEKNPAYLTKAQEVMEKVVRLNPQYTSYFLFVTEK